MIVPLVGVAGLVLIAVGEAVYPPLSGVGGVMVGWSVGVYQTMRTVKDILAGRR